MMFFEKSFDNFFIYQINDFVKKTVISNVSNKTSINIKNNKFILIMC